MIPLGRSVASRVESYILGMSRVEIIVDWYMYSSVTRPSQHMTSRTFHILHC